MKKISQLATIGLFAAVLPLSAAVSTSFNVDLSPGTQNFNVNATAAFKLDYTIDGSGNVSLDSVASTGGGARWNQIDNASAGTTTSSSLFNTAFTLTYSGTANALLTYTPNYGTPGTGSVLSTQGQANSNVLENGESITFTVSGTSTAVAGFSLDLNSFSYDLRLANGQSSFGVEDTSNNVVEQLIPNTSLSGTISATGISLGAGEAMTFRTKAGNAGGAGLSGFDFSVSAPTQPELPDGFDNGSSDNLWTTVLNWNPDGLPVSPSVAIINGYDVILNSALVSNPAALSLLDGSLTLSGNGSLQVESMGIGEVLESEASLVIEGSTASLSHSGSGVFTFGSSATVVTIPDNGGSSPLELDDGELVLEVGYQWILDGTNYTGNYSVGDQFVLANFGSLDGPGFGSGNEDGFTDTAGFRTRNFDLPADRRLQLVETATSIYYEVVAQTAATGPNIIIINVDDMAAGQHFGYDSDRAVNTPTLDALANTGIHFTEAFAASTVCGPSRYSLMTGRWASRNTSAQFLARYPLDTLGNFAVSDTELESDNQNLGAWLQQAGYRTGMVGKGHLTDDDLTNVDNWAAKGLLTYDKASNPANDPTTNAKMKHNHRVLCQRMRAFGFDYVSSYYKANLKELHNDACNVHNQEWITKGALDFIDENKDERFFLYMAPTINHGPVRNDLSKTLTADNSYTSAGYLPNEDYTFMPTRQDIINEVNNDPENNELISARETWLDYSIAAIVNKLSAHGIRNDTMIIFTSDHGEKDLNSTRSGQGPVIWGKSSLFDLGMRVPLIINWPNGISSPNRSYDEIVSHVDLAPTLLALTGASSLPTRPVDGLSLGAIFNSNTQTAIRDDVFAEIGYARAVRTKDHKYIAVRYDQGIYGQIDSGYLWQRAEGNTVTDEYTEPRPYYVGNKQLGSLAANSNSTYFDDDQVYNLVTDSTEDTNIYSGSPAIAYDLKKRLAGYLESIPNRPFREFDDSSNEFSPAPLTAPLAPDALESQFLDLTTLKLDWTDTASDELGYIIERSIAGGSFEIIAELPSGASTTAAVIRTGYDAVNLNLTIDPNDEDIVFRVSSYNTQGDTAATNPVDLLAPDSWRYRTFGATDPDLNDSSSQWDFDADGDGQSTLLEYALGSDPLVASSLAPQPAVEFTVDGAEQYLELSVTRDARRTVQINGSVSSDLTDPASWSSSDVSVVANEADHIRFRSTSPVGNSAQQFIRAEIVAPAP